MQFPKNGETLASNITMPIIAARFEDESGIDTDTISIKVDDVDVISSASITEDSVTYIPTEELSQGKQYVNVSVADILGNYMEYNWTFTIGETAYNHYYGQLHSHTNYSDGNGTPLEAFEWARDRGKADFFAITDHSNWFDNEKDLINEDITEVSQSTSN